MPDIIYYAFIIYMYITSFLKATRIIKHFNVPYLFALDIVENGNTKSMYSCKYLLFNIILNTQEW